MSDSGEEDSLDQLPNKPSTKLFETDVDLELFARAFKKLPVIWNVGHPKHMNKSMRNAGYMRLAKALRMRRGRGVVRRAVRAVRAFRLRLHETLLEACSDETRRGAKGVARARARLPRWAREADKYLHLLRDMLDRQDSASEPRTTRSGDKPSIPRAFASSRADGTPGMLWLSQRVVCGMRHAARRTGALDRNAAAVVAAQLGDTADHIYDLWCNMKRRALKRVQAVVLRGDVLPHDPHACRPTALDWAVADLALMYGENMLSDEHYQCYASLRAMLLTFSLVQRRGLEPRPGESPPAPPAWRHAAQAYSLGRTVISPVLLQRRWHLMKVDTRRRLTVAWHEGHCGRVLAIHRAIATTYPHVATAPMPQWADLLREGYVALPTNERGPAPGDPGWFDPVESDDDDLILVEKEIETIDLEENTNKKSTSFANVDERLDVVRSDLTKERTKSRDMPELDESDVDVENLDADSLPKIADDDSTDVDGLSQNSNGSNTRVSDSEQNVSDNNDDSNLCAASQSENDKIDDTNVSQSEQNQNNKGNKHADKTIHFGKEIVDVDETSLGNNVLEVLNSLDATRVEMSIMFSSDEEDMKGTFDTDLTVNDKDLTKDNIEALESGKNVVKSKSITVAHKAIVNSNDTIDDNRSTPKTKEVPAETYGFKIPNQIVFEDDQAIDTNDNSGDEILKPYTEMCNSNNKRTESLTKNVNMNESQTDITNSKDLYSRRSSSSDSEANLVIDLGRLSENLLNDNINESLQSLAVHNDAIRKAIEREMLSDDKDSSNNENLTVVNNPILLQLLESSSERRDNPIGKDNFASRNVKDYAEDLFQEAILKKHKREENLAPVKPSDLDFKEKLMEYAKNIVNDLLEEDGTDEEEIQNTAEDIDPKLLMCPVVVLSRLNITDVPKERPRSPTADLLQCTPNLSLLHFISKKLDQPLSEEFYQKKSNVRLLMMCRPCSVVLQRVELEARGGRVAKKVELPDIEQVRRNNRRILTAQVAPISVEQGIGSQRVSPDARSNRSAEVPRGAINARGAPRTWLDDSGARGEKRPSVEPSPSEEGMRVKCARRERSPNINDMAGVPTHEDLTRLLDDLAVRSVSCGKHDTALGEPGVRSTSGVSASCARCAALALAAPPRAVSHNTPDRGSQSPDHQSTRRPRKRPHRIRHRERNLQLDPEEAAREWQRQKNIGAEKFGLKPRSFQKRKVVEAPSEPATLTLVKDPEEAPRVLNKDLKPNEKIVTMNKNGQVVLNNNNTSSTDQVPSSHYVIDKDGTISSPIEAQRRKDAMRCFTSKQHPCFVGTPVAQLNKADSVEKVQTATNTENDTRLPVTKENLLKHAQSHPSLKLAPNLFNLNAVAAINKTLTHFTPSENRPDALTESPGPPKQILPIIIGVQSLAQNENQIKMPDKINTRVRDSVIQSPERLKLNLWGAKTPYSPQRIISHSYENKGSSPSSESFKTRVTTDNKSQNKPQTRYIVPASSMQQFAQFQKKSTASNVTKNLTHGGTTITNSKEANNPRRLHIVVSQGSVSQTISLSASNLQNQRSCFVPAGQISQASTVLSGCFKMVAANPHENTLQINSVQSGPPRIASQASELTFARKTVPLQSSVQCGVSESNDKVKTFPMHKQDSLIKVWQASGNPLEATPNSRNIPSAGELLQSTLLSASEDITSLLSENRTPEANFAETKTVQTGISENTYEVTLENIEQTLLLNSVNADRIFINAENIKSSTGSKDNLKNDANIARQSTIKVKKYTKIELNSVLPTDLEQNQHSDANISQQGTAEITQSSKMTLNSTLPTYSEDNLDSNTYKDLQSTIETTKFTDFQANSVYSVPSNSQLIKSQTARKKTTNALHALSLISTFHSTASYRPPKLNSLKSVTRDTDAGISNTTEDKSGETEDSQSVSNCGPGETEVGLNKTEDSKTVSTVTDIGVIPEDRSDETEDSFSPNILEDVLFEDDTEAEAPEKGSLNEGTFQDSVDHDEIPQVNFDEDDSSPALILNPEPNQETLEAVQTQVEADNSITDTAKICETKSSAEENTNQPRVVVSEQESTPQIDKTQTDTTQIISIEDDIQVTSVHDKTQIRSVKVDAIQDMTENSTLDTSSKAKKLLTSDARLDASQVILIDDDSSNSSVQSTSLRKLDHISTSEVGAIEQKTSTDIPSEPASESTLQDEYLTHLPESPIESAGVMSIVISQVKSLQESIPRTTPSDTIASSSQNQVQTSLTTSTQAGTSKSSRIPAKTSQISSFENSTSRASSVQDSVRESRATVIQTVPSTVSYNTSRTSQINSVQAGAPEMSLLHDKSPQVETLQANSTQSMPQQVNLIQSGTLLVNSVQAGPPQASLMQGGTLLLNSVQTGQPQMYSIVAGKPLVSAIEAGQPQASSMQPETLLVNSVQAGPSQVYSAEAGAYNATQVSYPMQVSAIQTGPPQTSFMQAGTLSVNSIQAGPSQTYSVGAGIPQISGIQTVPQTNWMQTLLVNSVQAGPSQVYSAPAGQLPVSLLPAGMPRTSPGQAEPSQVSAARDCTLQTSESHVKKRSWTQNENKNDDKMYVERLPIITAAEYIKGRDPTNLTVLHGPPDRAWWYLAGHYVMVTEAPIVEQPGIYYVLSPLSRLIIPKDLEDAGPTPPKQKKVEAEPSKSWLKVKSFARMCEDTPDILPPPRVFLENKMYQKLSNSPLTYAKVLTVIRSTEQCRAVLLYRDPLHIYCTKTGTLTPLHREPNSDNSAIILTGKPEIKNVLSELFSLLSSENTSTKHTLNYCPPRTNSPPNNLGLTNLPPPNLRATNPPHTNPPHTNPPHTNPPHTNPPHTNPPHTNRPPPALRPISRPPTNPPPQDPKKAAKEKAEKERIEIGRQIVKRALMGPWPTADANKSRPESPWDSKLRKTAFSETDRSDVKSLYGKVRRKSNKQPRVLNNQTSTPRQQKMILQPTDKQTYRLIMEGENDTRLEKTSTSVGSKTPAMSMGPTIAVGPAMNAALGRVEPPGSAGPVATAVPTPPEMNVARQKKPALTITPISKNPVSSILRKATGPEVTIKTIGNNAPAKNLSEVSKELPVIKKPEKSPVTSGGGLAVTVQRSVNSLPSLTIGSMGPVVTRVSDSEEIINVDISDEE